MQENYEILKDKPFNIKNFTKMNKLEAFEIITKKLGNNLVVNENDKFPTFGELLNRYNQRIFTFFHGVDDPLAWNYRKVHIPWTDTSNSEVKYQFLIEKKQGFCSNQF